MKKTIIRVNDANFEAIEKAVAEAEGKATARTISAGEIIYAAEEIEQYLAIPKKALEGTKVSVDLNAQTFPNAYTNRHTPISTHFDLVYTQREWRLERVYRARTNSPLNRYQITLTPEGKQAVLDRVSHMR